MDYAHLMQADPELYASMARELERQRDHLELIASENFTSQAVMEAVGSHLTNKYAEGYPARATTAAASTSMRSSAWRSSA